MEEQFIVELIEDLDHMRQLLERCVKKLRSRVTETPGMKANMMPTVRPGVENNDIRAEIERQRQAIMIQVEQVKAQAVAAASTARPIGMGSMPGMGIPGMGSVDPETLRELQQRIAAERNTDKSEGVEKSDLADPVLKT